MIIPDVNLLVYAYAGEVAQHARARVWWEGLLNGEEPVGLPWAVALGFVRLMTHPRVLTVPMAAEGALSAAESWYRRSHVHVLDPGPRHLALLRALLGAAGVAGNLTTDAHLAALAIEHGLEVCSNDADFARFSEVRWINPVAPA